jgi:hypothetical protein
MLATLLATSALLLRAPPAMRPMPRTPTIHLMVDTDDSTVFPKGPDGQTLITLASLDGTAIASLEMALAERNKVRTLEGKEKYADINAMIDAYMVFEGEQKGLSRAQCEDQVVRFLQRSALLSEGGADMKDPQTIVTFALLALIVIGGAGQILTNGLPTG